MEGNYSNGVRVKESTKRVVAKNSSSCSIGEFVLGLSC